MNPDPAVTSADRGTLERSPFRSLPWYSEVAAYFTIPEAILIKAVSPPPSTPAAETEKARDAIFQRFMTAEGRARYERVNSAPPETISDEERSTVWQTYIFVCLAGERRGFEKFPFYDHLIECLVEPLLEVRRPLKVLDYGCGASVFTRLLAEDFGERVALTTADVCTYSVEFTRTRNRLYSPAAQAVLIESVLSVPKFRDFDLILADTVFEHLPNAGEQIQGLVEALNPGGILVENYAGSSRQTPDKSDTFSAYQGRDANLDRMASQLELLFGHLPKKVGGAYEEDRSNRYWVKPGGSPATVASVRERLRKLNHLGTRVKRLFRRLWKKARASTV